ncbi:MAG: ROK family protein, partial [Candidatus Omnitrophica bacterium]|nr:ROK family protein [Candidatus Omnitrophota bacterium]
MAKYVLGVDVGGTNIKIGLVSPKLKVVDRTGFATKSFASDKKKLIREIAGHIETLVDKNGLTKKDIKGIGIGLPGLVDTPGGVVRFLPNISGWRNVPLKAQLEKRLNISVFLENDVNLITLGEWRYGAGRDAKNMICMTLGTGVGSGLILDGHLYRGPGFAAGELGHMPLNEQGPSCGCGGYGCLETYVGNKRLAARAEKMTGRKNVTLEEMNKLAKQGNKKAVKFWEEAATHIGNNLVGVVNLLNPQRI